MINLKSVAVVSGLILGSVSFTSCDDAPKKEAKEEVKEVVVEEVVVAEEVAVVDSTGVVVDTVAVVEEVVVAKEVVEAAE